MSPYRWQFRTAMRQVLRSLRGMRVAVVQYLTESPDALAAVCEPGVKHPVIRRKARVITGSRARTYHQETQQAFPPIIADDVEMVA